MQISMERGNITLWAAASSGVERFYQSIELPSGFIKAATITTLDDSQDPNVRAKVNLILRNDKDRFCYLDCIGTVIHQVVMIMRLVDMEQFVEELNRMCPKLDIDDQTGGCPERITSKLSAYGSQSEDMVTFGFQQDPANTSDLPRETLERKTQDGGFGITVPAVDEPEKQIDVQEPDDISTAGDRNSESQEESSKAPVPTHVVTPRQLNRVKPNAKKPLALSQNSKTDVENGLVGSCPF